jgi:membrane protease YdiL (CAAX protease family)
VLVPVAILSLARSGIDPAANAGDLAGWTLLVGAVLLLLALRPADAPPLHWTDVALVLVLWFLVQFGWLPEIRLRLLPEGALRAGKLVVLDLALLVYLVLRPLPRIGYTLRLNGRDAGFIAVGLLAYGVIAVPLGLTLGFLEFGVTPGPLGEWLIRWPFIFLFVALPEELLFRGIIQNQLEGWTGRPWLALAATAVVFGLAHLDNPLPGFPVPNWHYALMAALAGLAYGWTWRRTEKVTASATVHATVNFVWVGFLRG